MEGIRTAIRRPKTNQETTLQGNKPTKDTVAPLIRGRILIVDDERAVRALLVRSLKDYDTFEAESGTEAKRILKLDDNFDLILCDLIMPNGSGMDLYKWLENKNAGLAKMVVFVTGASYNPQVFNFLRNVDNFWIEKPFEVQEIRKTVSELVIAGRAAD